MTSTSINAWVSELTPPGKSFYQAFFYTLAKHTFDFCQSKGLNIPSEQIFALLDLPINVIPMDNICVAYLTKSKKENKTASNGRCQKPRQPGSLFCTYHNNRKKKADNASAPRSVVSSYVPSISLQGISFVPLTPEALSQPLRMIPVSGLPKPKLPPAVLALPA